MIRYRYIPFTFGKPKFMSREPEPVSKLMITLLNIILITNQACNQL